MRFNADNSGERAEESVAELALVERCKTGDRGALAELVRTYQARLFTVCLRMMGDRELAADMTQDALLKILTKVSTFDGRSAFSTWAITITMNVCRSKLRSEKLRRHASLDAMAEGTDAQPSGRREGASAGGANLAQTREPSASSSVEGHDDVERVRAALMDLDPEDRALLILADNQNLPYERIAAVLGVAVGTIKSRLHRARAALRDAVDAGIKKDRRRAEGSRSRDARTSG